MSDETPQEEAARPPVKQQRVRISAEMQDVIRLMAEKGIPLTAAAEQANITRDSAVRAFNRPHVKAAYQQLVKEIRENAAQEAYLGIREMSHAADSEPVRLRAKEWIAGVDGLAPLKRVEGKYTHNHQFAGFSFPSEPIDITPEHDGASSGEDDE